MITTFQHAGTADTPTILLDPEHGIFEISGRSIPEDPMTFYYPVKKWIERYAKVPNKITEFTFKLDYLNTGSSECVIGLLLLLQRIDGATILWCSGEGDEGMEEAGKEYAELVDIIFEFKVC